MVQGGLPAGSSVILQGPPGQEKLRFALAFLAEGLKAGGNGLVVSSSQSPGAVLAELNKLGVDLEVVTKDHRLRIVDWYSWSEETVTDIEERGLVIRSSIDLTNLGVALSRAIASLSTDGSPRAVIEMLSPAMNVYELTQVYAFAQSAKKKFDRYGFTSLVLLEKDMHSGPEITTLHQPFDGAIEVERTRTGDRIVRKIGVLHLKDTAADPTFRSLELTESGMRVVREAARPAASGASVVPGTGAVLESQEERARRLMLIMQIAGERLKLNPRDTDALFAMAAAQATLDDPRGGLQSLDRLAELDPNYPGLWVLKTKLHARLGEADRARQSRLRAQQADAPDTSLSESTVPCPMCDAPIAADATVCGNCGVKFALTRKLEDELEDLGHAAVQEMVEAELREGVAPPARKPSAAPPVPPPKPDVPPSKPTPKKGLTNGLVLARGAGRRTGMTNGLKGRTNGLRGRTNGLTNGVGRTNGLTNGVGRTNGLTNGVGRTNGLTNGLGRTNGLTNGLGRTNGLTNGLGRTNGLTNGLGGTRPMGFRSTGVRGMMRTAGWKLYVIPLVVVGLLLVPLFFVPEYQGPVGPIQIDGAFGDWTSVATEAMASGTILNPNVDVVRFGIVENLGPFAFYVQVAGSVLQGGGPSPGTMDSVWIFVDSDGSSTTGYRVDGLGADRLIEVSGYAGTIRSATLWEFDANRNNRDWGGWIKGTGTPAAASGSQIEAEAEWLAPSGSGIPVVATVHTTSWTGQTDMGDFPISPSEGSLSIVTDPQVPDVVSGNSVPLLRLAITGHGQAVSIDSLHVQIAGTAAPTAALVLRLMDGPTVLDQVTPTTRDVGFSFPAMSIGDGSMANLSVVGDFTATGGETFGIRLPSAHPFGLVAGAVGLLENPGSRTLGYLGSSPTTPQVDGGFDEWSTVQTDSPNDVSPQANPNIDLLHEGAQASGGSTFLYTDVSGRLLRGTPIPESPRPTPVQGPPNTADTDRDTVPDTIDPMPLDFNNDGTSDTQTSGDYDGDLVIDYGFAGGSDYWLNTTLPASFPPPFAGLPVSVYIGPTERPTALGEDVFRLFLDIDNSSVSGYSIGGIGADRLVELRGKDGGVTQSALLAFSGSFPGVWAWSAVSPVTVALNVRAVELSVSLSVANVYIESGDFWSSVDSSVTLPALAPGLSSFQVSAANQPLSVPWIQIGPQPMDTPIDGSSESVTTIYNHQRKVVRAGNVPGDTACDATNSDGCWYSVFYDQLPGTTPSTETITTGTKISGTFPTDINTDNGVTISYREANAAPAQTLAFDAAVEAVRTATTDPFTWTHTPVGTPRGAIVTTAHGTESTDCIVSVTYGGVTMTRVRSDADTSGEAGRSYIYFLGSSIPTGAQTVSADISASGTCSGTDDEFVSITYTAGADTEVLANNGLGENQANPSVTLSYGGREALAVMVLYSGLNVVPMTSTCSGNSACTLVFNEDLAGSWASTVDREGTRGPSDQVMGYTSATDDVAFSAVAITQTDSAANYQLSVKYDLTGVPSGSPYTLRIQGFHTSGEDVLVQVVDSTETTWTTRLTITKTADDNTDQTYDLTTDEYDGGSPNIRFIGATEASDTAQNDFSIDRVTIGLWDRIVIMRSSDTSGSTWGSQIILASGRTADSALVLARDSGEPSIAIDSAGFLHVVWVSASASGDQSTMNLVRYTKTTVAYPTQSELANAGNWEVVTNVDDAFPGFMPTVSTDMTNKPHVAWSGSKTSGTVYYKNKAAAWTTVDHTFVEQTTRQTTTSATYVDITGASIASGSFIAGRKYLLVFTAQPDSADTGTNAYIQALHGTTAFPGSEFSFLTNLAASRYTYYRFVVWTAVSGEGVKLQFRSETGGTTIGADQITMFKLDLGDLTESTDWFFSENTAGDTVTGTTWDGLASVTFTPSAASDWLVMTTMRGDPDDTAINYESRIARSGEAAETQPLTTWEGNDATNDRFVQTLARVFSLTTISNTFTQESRCDTGCMYPRSYSSAFALNLNRFEGRTSVWTEAAVALSTTDFATQVQTASLTPTRTADVWIVGQFAVDVDTTNNFHKFRLQVDNVDQPGTQTADAYSQWENWDSTDEVLSAIQTVENLGVAAHTFDLDASREGSTANAEDRILFAVALTIPLEGAWKATVSWGTTYTGLSVDVSPQNNYVSLARFYDAATDEIQYTVCKNLATNNCDAAAEFTKWDGTAGADQVVTAPEVAGYPSLAHTYEANGDVWVAYARDVDGTTRAIYARYLDYPSLGWQPVTTIDSLSGTIFTRPSIGIDANNDVHALYVATSGPQLYYNKRTGGVWGSHVAVGASTDNPSFMVRAPNDATYGTPTGGLYWKTTTSETFFYIPEFDSAIVPVIGVLVIGLLYRRKARSKQTGDPRQPRTVAASPSQGKTWHDGDVPRQ